MFHREKRQDIYTRLFLDQFIGYLIHIVFVLLVTKQAVYYLVFKLKNTASTRLLLRSNLPAGYSTILLEPGKTLRLNVSVPNERQIYFRVFDARTKLPAAINGKSLFVVYPVKFVTSIVQVITPGKILMQLIIILIIFNQDTYVTDVFFSGVLRHHITLHNTRLHYIALYSTLYTTLLYSTPLHITLLLHYITLHYITLHCIALHCIALHCIALHYTTLHYITLHYITLLYINLHYIR